MKVRKKRRRPYFSDKDRIEVMKFLESPGDKGGDKNGCDDPLEEIYSPLEDKDLSAQGVHCMLEFEDNPEGFMAFIEKAGLLALDFRWVITHLQTLIINKEKRSELDEAWKLIARSNGKTWISEKAMLIIRKIELYFIIQKLKKKDECNYDHPKEYPTYEEVSANWERYMAGYPKLGISAIKAIDLYFKSLKGRHKNFLSENNKLTISESEYLPHYFNSLERFPLLQYYKNGVFSDEGFDNFLLDRKKQWLLFCSKHRVKVPGERLHQ